MTPLEVLKMIKHAVMYGHEAFMDAYYIVLDGYETEFDPEKKEVLKELIDVYQYIHQLYIELDYHRERSEQFKYHEY
jgi:hypothetical protein